MKKNGFTLIELVMVIVILGVLAAVALPKFVDLQKDARIAKIEGAYGSAISSVNNFHLKWVVNGSPSVPTTIDGVQMGSTGYPTDAGLINAVNFHGFDTSILGSVSTDTAHPNCSISYNKNTGELVFNYSNGTNC